MTPSDVQRAHGDVLTAISDGLVALLKDYYGRGPTQVKSYYQDDLVVCVLRGGFSRVEQTLLEGGRGAAVIEQRMAFQDLMRDRFMAVIEHATGRKPIGFMSGNQQDPDLMCEVFILPPVEHDTESVFSPAKSRDDRERAMP
ncbi:Na-translocating system protein MpsC family protein [Conexibacter sp. CPCC 206217]|uniref:Na-translocating system protein MpsC family protein n=1 Tax=Conexibacter sp. CPCC 206217 TaxID=3064574 RepID=UPI0027224193|nr:Na-translocating system protein MpsC family protein [Conexibacter sp. CPCC 206217]MDO8208848.1 Na-translocating system protein MpsC family protein [Conexibacter sp. CPCC 206217]